MTEREDIQQLKLEGLEVEFRSLLPNVLKQCAAGRWAYSARMINRTKANILICTGPRQNT
jgi:hypothetical protein